MKVSFNKNTHFIVITFLMKVYWIIFTEITESEFYKGNELLKHVPSINTNWFINFEVFDTIIADSGMLKT